MCEQDCKESWRLFFGFFWARAQQNSVLEKVLPVWPRCPRIMREVTGHLALELELFFLLFLERNNPIHGEYFPKTTVHMGVA